MAVKILLSKEQTAWNVDKENNYKVVKWTPVL